MVLIEYVQTILTKTDLEKLKKKTNQPTTKGALAVAVEHYLACDSTGG